MRGKTFFFTEVFNGATQSDVTFFYAGENLKKLKEHRKQEEKGSAVAGP